MRKNLIIKNTHKKKFLNMQNVSSRKDLKVCQMCQDYIYHTTIKLVKLVSKDEAKTEIIQETADKIEEILSKETDNLDSTDEKVTDKIRDFCSQILEDFKEILEEDKDKGDFVHALTKIFGILVTSKYTSLAKAKKILRETAQIPVKLWPESKRQ